MQTVTFGKTSKGEQGDGSLFPLFLYRNVTKNSLKRIEIIKRFTIECDRMPKRENSHSVSCYGKHTLANLWKQWDAKHKSLNNVLCFINYVIRQSGCNHLFDCGLFFSLRFSIRMLTVTVTGCLAYI